MALGYYEVKAGGRECSAGTQLVKHVRGVPVLLVVRYEAVAMLEEADHWKVDGLPEDGQIEDSSSVDCEVGRVHEVDARPHAPHRAVLPRRST